MLKSPTLECWTGYKVDTVAHASHTLLLRESHPQEHQDEDVPQSVRSGASLSPSFPPNSSALGTMRHNDNAYDTDDLEEELQYFKRIHFSLASNAPFAHHGNFSWHEALSQNTKNLRRALLNYGVSAAFSLVSTSPTDIQHIIDEIGWKFGPDKISTSLTHDRVVMGPQNYLRGLSHCLMSYRIVLHFLSPDSLECVGLFWEALRVLLTVCTTFLPLHRLTLLSARNSHVTKSELILIVTVIR